MDNTEEKKTKRKKLFLYLGMGLSVVSIAATCVGIYCSGRRDERLSLSESHSNELKRLIKLKDESVVESYMNGLDKGLELKDEIDSIKTDDAYERGYMSGLRDKNSVTSRRLKEAYDEGYKDGEFHEKYRLLDELSTPDLSVPEQRYLAGCCDIKLVKMRDGEGEMMLSNHTNPRAENSIAMMKELKRNSL